MRIAITGSAGYVGRHLVQHLDLAGHDLFPIDVRRCAETRRWDPMSVEDAFDPLGLHRHKLDAFAPEVIIHLAATPRVQYSIEHPHETLMNNVTSTSHVLEYARQEPKLKRVVLAGSSAGTSDEMPQSPYGVHKQCQESLARVYRDLYGLDVVVCRLFNVWNEYLAPTSHPTLIAALILATRTETPFVFYGADQMIRRTMCHMDDTVSGLASVATTQLAKPCPRATYNVCDDQPRLIRDVVSEFHLAAEAYGHRLEIIHRNRRPGEMQTTRGSVVAMDLDFAWKPQVSLPEGINRIFDQWEPTKNDT